MLKFIGNQVRIYQDSQSAAKSGKEMISTAPSLDLEAPGPSRVASSHIGSAEKGFAIPSHENIVGSSLGMVQETIWMMLLWMVKLMKNHRVSFKPICFVKNFCPSHAQLPFFKSPQGHI